MGNTSRQTQIELTRKIPARKNASSIQIDIIRFQTADIEERDRSRQVGYWTNTERHQADTG